MAGSPAIDIMPTTSALISGTSKDAFTVLMAAGYKMATDGTSKRNTSEREVRPYWNEDNESDCSSASDCPCLECTYENHDNARFWEREGVLHQYFESSYLNEGRHHAKCNRQRKINYELCTPAKLKRFVNDRLLQDPYPRGITLKYFYIPILEQADKEPHFEFLDLPPELRLMVYRELLLFNNVTKQLQSSDVGKVHTQILRTCIIVNEEATRVLYDENTFVAQVRGRMGKYAYGNGVSARVHNSHACAIHFGLQFLQIPGGINEYPGYLRRISCLHIRVQLEGESEEVIQTTQVKPLNQFIFTLASFLMDGHRIKHLYLDFALGPPVNDTHYGAICYPLQRLRNIKSVTLSGGAPKTIESTLLKAFKKPATAINTLRLWQVMSDEAETQMAIHRQMRNRTACDCSDYDCDECLNRVDWRNFELEDCHAEAGFSSAREEEVHACLARLRIALNAINVVVVKESVQKMIKQRNARRAYETVSTYRQLENAADNWEPGCETPLVHDSVKEDWEDH